MIRVLNIVYFYLSPTCDVDKFTMEYMSMHNTTQEISIGTFGLSATLVQNDLYNLQAKERSDHKIFTFEFEACKLFHIFLIQFIYLSIFK